MKLDYALQKQKERFYPLIEHPVQLELVRDNIRFKLVPAGRRSGKTERGKRLLAKTAMREENRSFFAAAPTHGQARKIWWDDLKVMTGPAHSRPPSESDGIIYLLNGSQIHVFGLDKPERIEGQIWHGGLIDEFANIKAGAWEENIRPALSTVNPLDPEYRAWCWILGVPEGLNHYFDLYDKVKSEKPKDWKIYAWPSADILPEEEIEVAKASMSSRQFRQEYEASFETAAGRIYEDYSEKNYTDEVIKKHEQLLWYHDFNFTPLSSGIGVRRGNNVFLLDEIVLSSAVASQSALEFCEKYKDHTNKSVIIYGDPAGRAGEKHGHSSDYIEIEAVLKQYKWKFERRVKRKAPAIKDRQNAVRAMILNAKQETHLFVNPNNAPYTHKGLATVQLKDGSSFLENETEYQHITTAIGYFIDYEFPIKKVYEVKAPQRWGHAIG